MFQGFEKYFNKCLVFSALQLMTKCLLIASNVRQIPSSASLRVSSHALCHYFSNLGIHLFDFGFADLKRELFELKDICFHSATTQISNSASRNRQVGVIRLDHVLDQGHP
jgi:hypothetical protein